MVYDLETILPKAISYTRFSALHQGKGSTSSRQIEMINRWLYQHPNVEPSALSRNDVGKSAFRGDHLNHGFGQIMNAIEEGKIRSGDFILVEAIDRIGRLQMWQMFDIIKKIITAGVTIVTLEDDYYYSESTLNNTSSIFILIGKIQQAHEYSKNLSRRLLAANEQKRRRARAGEKVKIVAPFWLANEGFLIERKSAIVLDCIELYLKGRGPRKIIQILIKVYPELETIHPTTLKRWFEHRALIGEWETGDEVIQNVFEPLIDHATFYQLKREIKSRSKKMSPEQSYHLSGLVFCQRCNAKFYFRRKVSNGNLIIYANCSTYLKRGAEFCDNNKTWPYEAIKLELEWGTPIALSALVYNEQKNKLSEKVEHLKLEKLEKSNKIDILLDALTNMPNQKNILDKVSRINSEIQDVDKEIYDLEKYLVDDNVDTQSFSDEVIDNTNAKMESIVSDPIYYRESLKKSGYKILIDGNKMTSNTHSADRKEIELLRRSTKHKCYILKVENVEHEVFDEGSDTFEKVDSECFYIAINRFGVLETDESESALVEKLINKEDYELLFKYPNE